MLANWNQKIQYVSVRKFEVLNIELIFKKVYNFPFQRCFLLLFILNVLFFGLNIG